MEYTAKQKNRRYRLHYNCRQNGVGVDVAQRTCNLIYGGDTNKYANALVNEFNYAIQNVIYIEDKRVKKNK